MSQKSLFDNLDRDWNEHWVDMPEYVQEKEEPYQKIIIRFRNEEDVKTFAKLIEQTIHKTTASLWFPKLEWKNSKDRKYIRYED